MKAIQFLRYGERLRVKDVPMPKPNKDQVLLKMKYSPINPSDLYFSLGVYGIKPNPPQIVGFEGVGQIIESNNQNQIGKYAAMYKSNGGCWAQYSVSDQDKIMILDDDKQLQQFSCAFVNPLTAMAFLQIYKENNYDILVQNCAFSKVGQMMMSLMNQQNLLNKSIHILRNNDQKQQLQQKYKNINILNQNDDDFQKELEQLQKDSKKNMFIDAVGGDIAVKIFDKLNDNSIMYSYGVQSHQKIQNIDPQQLVFRRKEIKGFWLDDFIKKQNNQNYLYNLKQNIKNEILSTEIGNIYEIDQIQEAIQDYKQKSIGRILMKF